MHLLSHLSQFFEEQAPLAASDSLVVAFSGGPDSLALLLALEELANRTRFTLLAAHVDHGADSGAQRRAKAAAALAHEASVPMTILRAHPAASTAAADHEADLRRRRYAALERFRQEVGARYVATAHHRQDQVETILLRLLFGSGIVGMAGIQPQNGRVVRPLLAIERSELSSFLAEHSNPTLTPVDDPTNHDTRISRNRLRHQLLPYLARRYPDVEEHTLALANAAQRLRGPLLALMLEWMKPQLSNGALRIERDTLNALPATLWPYALAALHRSAGSHYPPSAAVAKELRRQIHQGSVVGCSAGNGWRWRSRGSRLLLERKTPRIPAFTYTVSIPGAVEIAPLSLRLSLREGPVEKWMFEGSHWRAGLNLPAKSQATVRTRRPGDRLQPLGCSYSRRLKDILIDRHIPRDERDALPLLVVDESIAWVPGVTIAEPYRLRRDQDSAWVAEVVHHE